MGDIIVGIQIRIGNNSAGAGCVDELTVTDIDAHMGQTGLVCILEEDQIAGLEIALGNGCAFGVHGNLRTADIDAVAAQHIVNEAGAVETAGISAAPLVRNA